MSITPPPSYPLHQAQPPAHLTQQDLKQPLDTVAKDLNKGLDQKEEARPDKPNNGLVNVFNYTGAVFNDEELRDYEFADLLPSFPKIDWPDLEEIDIDDRAFHADPEKSRFFKEVEAQGGKVINLNPAIGAEVVGVKLTQLSDAARDDLALLLAERGVVVFRKQDDLDIEAQTKLGSHWGPLHHHATTGVPSRPGLEHVHVVYADSGTFPDRGLFAPIELYHSDVTYEIQPPGPTILKLITAPECGGDTLFTSGGALYSSLSPAYQTYLDSLYAVHSGKEQARGAANSGQHVRRQGIETIHPVVRVNPVTGIKSVFVNPGFTRRILGVGKAESDNTLQFLYSQFAQIPEYTARVKWEKDDVAIWHNAVVNHSASFDFWPQRRHAVRVTPTAERPLSVADYEAKYNKKATDFETERFKRLGLVKPVSKNVGLTKERGYKD